MLGIGIEKYFKEIRHSFGVTERIQRILQKIGRIIRN